MLGENKLKQIADKVLKISGGDETEVLLMVSENGLTRFANSEIHQNMEWEDIGISVRIVYGKKIGVAGTNKIPLDPKTRTVDQQVLQDVVHRAESLAKLQREDPYFTGLPDKEKLPNLKNEKELARGRHLEKERAAGVSTIIKKALDRAITASGSFSSTISEIAVANSHGVWAYHVSAASDLSTILIGPTSTGFAAQVGQSPLDIDAELVADRAINKVVLGAHPQTVSPGEWEVVLEPQAVNEMMVFFAMYGPNARIYHENASFLSGNIGKKVTSTKLSIIDNPLDSDSFPMPFDFEGFPKRKVEIIKNGLLKDIIYDSYHANRFGAKNTGHAWPAPNTWGPFPTHLSIAPGKNSSEQIIKNIKKGLLVTRFWYVRVLNPRSLAITGMTRDGLFLIENGRLSGGVKNLRFNQSIPQALNEIVNVGKELEPLSSFELELGINRMPHLHIKRWNFTSGTLF